METSQENLGPDTCITGSNHWAAHSLCAWRTQTCRDLTYKWTHANVTLLWLQSQKGPFPSPVPFGMNSLWPSRLGNVHMGAVKAIGVRKGDCCCGTSTWGREASLTHFPFSCPSAKAPWDRSSPYCFWWQSVAPPNQRGSRQRQNGTTDLKVRFQICWVPKSGLMPPKACFVFCFISICKCAFGAADFPVLLFLLRPCLLGFAKLTQN